jgi:hypothetical protein
LCCSTKKEEEDPTSTLHEPSVKQPRVKKNGKQHGKKGEKTKKKKKRKEKKKKSKSKRKTFTIFVGLVEPFNPALD